MRRWIHTVVHVVLRRAYSSVARPIVRNLYLARRVRTSVEGVKLMVTPGVFHPKLFVSSRVLGRYLIRSEVTGAYILDLGTGTGVVGILAEKAGARVLAVDINPGAVACALDNAAENGCERFTAHESDLFESIAAGTRFDVIAWNPPFYPRQPRGIESFAWYAGEDYSVLRRFASSAREFLRPGGKLILVLSSDLDLPKIFGLFSEHSWRIRVPYVETGFFEDHLVVELVQIQKSVF